MSSVLPPDRTDETTMRSWWFGVIGIIALAICVAGGAADPARFLRAYLPAFLFFFGLALGSMAVLMIYHLTGGAWGYLVRRILEAEMGTLPLIILMFLPIAFGIRYLYPFAQPETVAVDRQLQHESFYLTPGLFWWRAVGYFVAWMIMATLLRAWSRQQEERADLRLAWKCEQLSGIGAVVYGVTLHFAAVDWAMSIQPAFHSSIWGPLFALGQLLSALAVAVIVLQGKSHAPPLADLVSRKALGDLGSLLLTFLIAWAYMAWFQFMLIWIANLPSDIEYYLPRSSTGWLIVIWAIVLLHFVVPFFLLLMRAVKRNGRRLAATAWLLLVMQLIFVYYEITPSFAAGSVASASPVAASSGLAGHWMDFLMPIALGGIWLAFFLRRLHAQPLIVARDPQRGAAEHLRHLDEEEAENEEAVA
jgi:hypothetical protein